MKCINHAEVDAIASCVDCGSFICGECTVDVEGKKYCKKCISQKLGEKPQQKKNPAVAAILSFFIGGLGQIYNGQIGKGVLIFFTAWLIIPWLYGIFDAYRVANKINAGQIVAREIGSGCVIAVVVLVFVIFIGTAILGLLAAIAIPNFVRARTVAQANACINNLRMIETAKEVYTVEHGLSRGSLIPIADNDGFNDGDGIPDALEEHIKNELTCFAGGKYTIGTVGEKPTCNIGINQTPDYKGDDHILVSK